MKQRGKKSNTTTTKDIDASTSTAAAAANTLTHVGVSRLRCDGYVFSRRRALEQHAANVLWHPDDGDAHLRVLASKVSLQYPPVVVVDNRRNAAALLTRNRFLFEGNRAAAIAENGGAG